MTPSLRAPYSARPLEAKRNLVQREVEITNPVSSRSAKSRRGITLVELMVAAVVIGILVSFAAPSFQRAVEQSRADIAGANLRAIWSAQRCYWLDARQYSEDLTELQTLGLLDTTIGASGEFYVFEISSADSVSFTATATRTGSSKWSGHYSINESGVLTGVVQATGENDVVPGFQ